MLALGLVALGTVALVARAPLESRSRGGEDAVSQKRSDPAEEVRVLRPPSDEAPADRPSGGGQAEASQSPSLAQLQAMIARFVPAEIGADIAPLPEVERRALARLIEAARVMDAIFLSQVWAGNNALLQALARDETPLARARLHYFLINKGPWSRLDHGQPFIPGVPPKPEGASFYPPGATKSDIARWIESLPDGDKARATGFFTTIRVGPGASGLGPGQAGGSSSPSPGATGPFTIVPYSLEYQGPLAEAARHLRAAAALTREPSLARYLNARADAFLSNEYYASDVAWMELDSTIEPTIGPYEVYEDEWFNYKAGFEAFITIRDAEETRKLQTLGSHLQGLEDTLPIDPKYRNPKLGALAPIRVVNEVFAAGDGNRGVQTAAFNLPNDERVIREKGAKRVMLKNVQDAKFRMVLVPISKVALAPADQSKVAFDAFFTHILMHELMHGLGPHSIQVGGRATTVRQALKETSSAIEEAKADISGLWALKSLADRGIIDKAIADTMYTTFLASAFRSIRFGINEAHGRGIAIQLNFLLDQGAVRVRTDGTFEVVAAKFPDAAAALTREIMTLQAEGSYTKAKGLIDRLGVVRPEVQKVLDRLTHVPVDIEPKFVTAEAVAGGGGR
jgi:hypothetical protein